MRLAARWSSILLTLNVLALGVIFYSAAKEFVIPKAAEWIYKDDYKELVFKCDSVMRDHFIAKTQVMHSPSDEAIKNLRAAEVGLLACHDYDVLRKRLISYGLGENDLSRLGLEAIEERAKDVHAFVETHEIRY
jgi:hypothetical protein